MGSRLARFDYSTPYFYMVTIKAVKGAMPFACIRREQLPEDATQRPSAALTSPARYLEANAITHAFCTVVMRLHNFWRCIEPITCFSIMPDHIHLLIKIRNVENRVSLPKIVWQLKRRLEQAYWATGGAVASNTPNYGYACMSSAASRADGLHVFEREWHDWIVKSDGQLKAFTRYIRENPYRSWLRSCHRENFRRVEEIDFLGPRASQRR